MPTRLSANDASVLGKIQDPESVADSILIDPLLPPDPNLTDHDAYVVALTDEKKIMNDVLALEKLAVTRPEPPNPSNLSPDDSAFRTSILAKWLSTIIRFDELIDMFPRYASARNNRVVALRMVYGDGMLVKLWVEKDVTDEEGRQTKNSYLVSDGLPALDSFNMEELTMRKATQKILADLTQGIVLLTPRTVFGAVSPQQATHLANLYMQRGRIYRVAAQKLAKHGLLVGSVRTSTGVMIRDVELKAEFRASAAQKESHWSSLDFEENASKDFMMAGRYGNTWGKGLAVATNPTAKLCGEIVKGAMRNEVGTMTENTIEKSYSADWNMNEYATK